MNWLLAALTATLYCVIGSADAAFVETFCLALLLLDCVYLVRAGWAASTGMRQGFKVVRHLAVAFVAAFGIVALAPMDLPPAYAISRALTNLMGFLIFFRSFMKLRGTANPGQ